MDHLATGIFLAMLVKDGVGDVKKQAQHAVSTAKAVQDILDPPQAPIDGPPGSVLAEKPSA